ncbi:flagellar basal body L-ring protein FlgH [Rickettsia endosymbiont of Cardiosporidium cionae]|uniref:flagellar basal body L-ring protein FlgH n=1 Tax=Rickettsia endosymbiont of Cardiosporidium cionae TaxID=2777155 RepID=UPI0018951B1E|nr:flagellar basal body L-ring protein FlgH [Rickettsia endosymbiont of Cardiosporidium cionae]KAF8818206.1 Flagellar L-ring protein [Rickettsia endosymbiont of Cardiosporidium cionae]
MFRVVHLVSLLFFLCSCSDTLERLSRLGKAPSFSNLSVVENNDSKLASHQESKRRNRVKYTNSLWGCGSVQFFQDNKSWNTGDILRVIVQIKDSASLNNSTKNFRSSKKDLGITNLFGAELAMKKFWNNKVDTKKLVNTNTNYNHKGTGNIEREEEINTEIAATVIKILPNGNLVIHGNQEIRVNYELRQVRVVGIVRPKDITSDNSINSNKIAEARIAYGGVGVVSDVQQPTTMSQFLDIISPF